MVSMVEIFHQLATSQAVVLVSTWAQPVADVLSQFARGGWWEAYGSGSSQRHGSVIAKECRQRNLSEDSEMLSTDWQKSAVGGPSGLSRSACHLGSGRRSPVFDGERTATSYMTDVRSLAAARSVCVTLLNSEPLFTGRQKTHVVAYTSPTWRLPDPRCLS